MRIPIFPLAIVIFPNSKYPLHIFEPRYKKLINKCLAEKSGFGIVSRIGETVSDVGVYADIINVIKIYESGEMDIVIKGNWRFRKINYKRIIHLGTLLKNLSYSKRYVLQTANFFRRQ